MATSGKLLLVDTTTQQQTSEVPQDGLDVFFPDGVGWTEVLDCRIPPYTQKSIEDNCTYAHHQRKAFILVTADQVEKSAPPTGDLPTTDG